jgi:hypothetical protein
MDFFVFDEVTSSAIDLPRVEAFLTRYDEARKYYAAKRKSPSRSSRRARKEPKKGVPRTKPRITGWYYDNPPEVERAFREGFLEGVLKGLPLDDHAIVTAYRRAMKARGHLYRHERWCDVKAARLRGTSHGLWYLHECHEEDRSDAAIARWVSRVKAWAVAELPTLGADGRIHGDPMPPEPKEIAAAG